MESVYLKTLVEVVNAGSLSRAAETLCVTQPAVSRRIKFLEDQYGCELLDRSGPRLRPTRAGRLVYRKAVALLEIEDEIVDNLRRMDGKTRIAFGGSAGFCLAHLPSVLQEFMLYCGDPAELSFAMQPPAPLVEALEEGGLDVGVVELCRPFDLSRLRSLPLPDDLFLFISSPKLGLPSPEATVDSLLDLPLFTRPEACCCRQLLDANLRRIGRELAEFHKVIVFDDMHVALDAVRRGEGVSFLSHEVVSAELADGRLRSHRIPGFQHSNRRALVLGNTSASPTQRDHFVRVLLARFGLAASAESMAAGGPETAKAVPAGAGSLVSSR